MPAQSKRSKAAKPAKPESAQDWKKLLTAEYPNLWDVAKEEEVEEAMAFAEDYCSFLDLAKTEREFVQVTVEAVEELGFVPLSEKKSLRAGDKVYHSVHGKGMVLAVIGKQSIEKGFRILGAHIDSPRADLKPAPVYEEGDLALFKTHYYGGIKKYQWTARPLALHGMIVRKDGSKLVVNIGEKEEDPVFCFTDLLPHLGREQMKRPAPELIAGEELNVLVGGRPYPDPETAGRFKLGLLKLLYEMYGITEKDFVTAEIEVVPAGRARMVGFDRSFIGGYGQDDRVCAYTSLQALCAVEKPQQTTVCMLTDKEEIGSNGNTGAQSRLYEDMLSELFALQSKSFDLNAFHRCLANTKMLSSDVINGFDPTFASVSDPHNTAYMGRGICIEKYTGSGGKYGASDASAELMHEITHLFDAAGVPWQTGELGKVDAGGGGTICQVVASWGIQAVDCGVPVLSMHAPFEVTHTLDVYYTYRAYKAFLEAGSQD